MTKTSTDRFFVELNSVGAEIAGPDSAISKASKQAVEAPGPLTFVKAQEALSQLSDDLRDQILKQVHLRLRTDVEAIWDQLPHATRSDRPN
ncbi:hypothetical protein [Ruegeria hyattellae]|uniref:hypothetical protein n=1 Tax=Ruegeria hyattellae TaxID=3233337 RepID=UPI00355BF25C